MKFKRKKLFVGIILLGILIASTSFFVLKIPFQKLNDFSSNAYLTAEELKEIENSEYFGPFLRVIVKNDELVKASNE